MTADEIANDVATAVADTITALTPIFEGAKGLRAHLEADGWSPTIAEQIAFEYIQSSRRGLHR